MIDISTPQAYVRIIELQNQSVGLDSESWGVRY